MKEDILTNEDIESYIFLQENGQILKFKISIEHLNITSEFENYINATDIYSFDVLTEKEIENLIIPINLLRYIGKSRLEGNLLKTKNYLVPPITDLTKFLSKKYKIMKNTVTFDSLDLEEMCKMKQSFSSSINKKELSVIKKLCSSMNVELVEKYDLNEESIENSINNIGKLIGPDKIHVALLKTRWILYSSKNNKKLINELGLKNKFVEVIQKEKQKTMKK